MRLALVIAPSDARSGDAALRREALAWLRGRLARFGFHVVIVGGVQDPHADVERAIGRVSPGDTVLVHASGRLGGREAIAFGESGLLPLGSLTEWLASRAPAHVSFVLELTHEEDAGDALLAAEILAAAVQSLGAKARGYPVLAAVRPLGTDVDRVAFTRLALPNASEDAGPPPTEALVAGMYDAASATAESHAVAQCFTFSRGAASMRPPPPFSLVEPRELVDPVSAAEVPARVEPSDVVVRADVLSPEDLVEDAPLAAAPSIHSQIAEATETCDWPRAVELRRLRLDELASPRQKSRELVAIARILQVELGDAEGAIQALEMARALDQRPTSVLQALRRGYERLGRWGNVAEVTAALAALTEAPVERAALAYACARIALEKLSDLRSAIAWLEAAVENDPSNADAQAALHRLRPPAKPDAASREKSADRLFAEGADEDALAELDKVAGHEPFRVSAYEKAFASHRRAGRTDAAYLAALALEELDAADVDQQILIDQFRSVGPVRVRASFDDEAWRTLSAPGDDDVLRKVFAAVERAAMAARADELRERRRLVALDPAERLSETSTASVVRTMRWAARVLSVDCPDMYLRDGAAGIEPILVREPSVALGPSVASGLTAKDLAFLAGRHLTYYRRGHKVLLYYPDREELTTLLFAAAQVALPSAATNTGDPAVRALRARLARHLDAEDRAELDAAVRALDARGGSAALGAFMSSVELTAARAGLLLCGDLATAMAIGRAEPRQVAGIPSELRRGDLVAFCASRAHVATRQRFVVTAPESILPPAAPTSSAHLSS